MSGPTLGLAGLAAILFVLFFLRIPAGFAMALVGTAGFALATTPQAAFSMAESEFWSAFSKYGFTVIPMFVLLGEIIYHAGYSDRLFRTAYTWFGHWRGGQAITTILASAGFSAICGSNTATAATMTSVAIPSMKRYHYHPILSAGSVAAGSTLGVMIPPSIVLVVYGLDRGQSIGRLFFGALIPSAILAVFMMMTATAIVALRPEWGPRGRPASWREKFRALPDAAEVFLLFGIIMAALLTGQVTATEAAATSSTLGLILCALRRKLSWEKFRAALLDTLRISAMIFMIVAGATIFGRFMAVTRLPFAAATWISELDWPNWAILLLMIGCYILGGCLMDALAFLLISLPIFFPLVQQMGYDPIWFGVLICLVTTLGAITPPIGICCYVISGQTKDISAETVFKGAMLYIPAYTVTLLLLLSFPESIVLWLSTFVR
jgi:tripartite ATP-independent transporter DctM subunit